MLAKYKPGLRPESWQALQPPTIVKAPWFICVQAENVVWHALQLPGPLGVVTNPAVKAFVWFTGIALIGRAVPLWHPAQLFTAILAV